jgi:hypothetical protein
MAITITQNPQTISPGCNPFEWVFESTNAGLVNFSFIVELEINGVYHSTHEVYAENNLSGRFDASEILRAFLVSNLVTDGTLSQVYVGAFCSVGINIFEKYGTPPIVQPEPESSVKATAFNGSLRHQDFILWNYQLHNASNYNPLTASPSQVKFLTTIPRDIKRYVGIDQSCFLGIFSLDENVRLNIRLFSATGSTIANESINLVFPVLAIIDCSPQTIIANTSITALNFDACVYYRVLVQGMAPAGTYTGASESFEFYMDTECKRYPTKRLHWLNKFGVWDSMSFDLDSIDTTEVNSNDYARNTGVWDNGAHSYPLYQGQMINASKTSKDMTVINSDWMKPDLQQWLVRELGESPRVYLEVEGGFEPVKITNTSYLLKTRKRNGLIQEQFTLERTYMYISQLN